MAHSRTAKKRIRQNIKARARNRWRKNRFREAIRNFNDVAHHGNLQEAEGLYKSITKILDQVAAKGTIHKNTASRYKSRLAARLNSLKKPQAA
jgi:small subunit ribosomal protein S20